MATHVTTDGRPVTVHNPAAPHEIVLRVDADQGMRVTVGCRCGAPRVASVDGADDQWALFNALAHNTRRAPFRAVDPQTGRPT